MWLPAARRRQVWFFIAGRTGMKVKRAAIGGEGYVLDHYDRGALQPYLDAVGAAARRVARHASRAVFCDSLEVYGSDWTPDLLPEFARRRGYDLRRCCRARLRLGRARDAVRQDWGRTLSELYEERFLAPLAEWARARGSKLRIQGYGIPPATVSSNRLADLTEGEGAQWRRSRRRGGRRRPATCSTHGDRVRDVDVAALAVVRATPLDIKAEADRHFLQGVNQLIGHGWPSTPAGVDGDGWRFNWRFYAAGVFNDRNPWWIAMPDVSRYLQRVSALLREGRPVNDVALYLPTSDAHGDQAGQDAPARAGARAHRPGGPARSSTPATGSTSSTIGARARRHRFRAKRVVIGAQRFRTVVLPAVRTMPAETLSRLRAFAAAGGRVIATDRLPETTPGCAASRSPSTCR